jgi:uncharacterized protein (TIGR02285 family)
MNNKAFDLTKNLLKIAKCRIKFKLLIVLFLLPWNLYAQKTLDWMKFNQIPVNISEGKYKGEGISEKIFDLFKKEIFTDFTIQKLWVNHKRFIIEAKSGNNCYFGWKTFPRYRLFSNPLLIWFPMGIIAHRSAEKKFGSEGTVLSLEKLIQNPDLRIGLARKFAYSPDIQRLMSKYGKNKNIFWEEGNLIQSDLRMILNKRIDYTIGWPMQPVISEKILGVPNEFIYYNIEEDQKYLYIGISCSNSEAGRSVIKRTNDLLKRKDINEKIVESVGRWTILSKQWRELYQSVIIEGQSSPLVVHMEFSD